MQDYYKRINSSVFFPDLGGKSLPQDGEWCIYKTGEEERKIRFHDYHEIYDIPGLYEYLFMDRLQCQTPYKIRELLMKELKNLNVQMNQLKVLDLGAGNGVMGDILHHMGVEKIVGIDILKKAQLAAERDHSGVYNDYFIVNLVNSHPEMLKTLNNHRFNCLVTASALGFGDIPPNVFKAAYNLIINGGIIAFNIKDIFIEKNDQSGFFRLFTDMIDENCISILQREHYRHRLSTAGSSLYYTAIVGLKNSDLPF